MSGLALEDIQGDIVNRLPKNYENFIFFCIENPENFRAAIPKLLELKPPATGAHVVEARKQLSAWDKSKGRMPLSFFNIGLSKDGLEALDVNPRLLGDDHFWRGQLAEAGDLGDPMIEKEDGTRVPDWEADFLELDRAHKIHGIILVAGEKENVESHGAEVLEVLEGAVSVLYEVKGHTLNSRHSEHFGWADGISNPAVPGFTEEKPTKGQHVISPGVLLLGAAGDPKQNERPGWALGSSFMVFRKLQQFVPEFKQFLLETAIKRGADPLDPEGLKKAAQLLCAQLFGRWPNGAPLERTNDPNDPFWTKKENLNDFVFEQHVPEPRCPYGAHIRKTNPRNDIPKDEVLASSIMRTGIPYGDEIKPGQGPDETKTTVNDRGLAFVAYQSSIEHGFWLQQKHWANNPKFAPVYPKGTTPPGFDGIIGQNGGFEREGIFGIGLKDYVKPRAGGYFFVPSIKALETISKGLTSSSQ
ncbi:hypothetical protein FRC11_008231 [Ceratobasidium sp. 423]|nr:hypothetical protein FRC11_008231 [Ceratobasidium sp. 423]